MIWYPEKYNKERYWIPRECRWRIDSLIYEMVSDVSVCALWQEMRFYEIWKRIKGYAIQERVYYKFVL